MLHHLIHVNYTTLLLVVFMCIFLLFNTALDKRISRLFLISIFYILILLTADSIESWTESLASPTRLRIFVSALGYTLRPLVILNVILLLIRSKKNNHKLLFLPGVINGIISFSALFTDIAFSYSADNQFVRGPLGISAYIVSGLYLLILMIFAILYIKERNIYETYILFSISFFAVASIYLEVTFSFDGFINSTLAVSLIFYYLFFNAQTVNRDILTRAFNRRCFYIDAQKNFSKLKAVISIDLNDLKIINDTQGHSGGDMALYTVVNTLKKALPLGCSLYRTGGDEFMILCFKHNQTTLENLIVKMKAELSKTPYTCAMGLALLQDGDTLDQVCIRADANMYEDKVKIKGTLPR